MSPANAAQILADLRRTHAQKKADPESGNSKNYSAWSMRLTLEEVDVILAIADERDELRRRLCDDFEGTHTGDPIGREERETPPREKAEETLAELGRTLRETPPRGARVTEGSWCRFCGTHITRDVHSNGMRGIWEHDLPGFGAHPATMAEPLA